MEWVAKYWVEILFSLIVAIGQFLYRRAFKGLELRVSENEAIRLGVQSLLRDRIIHEYNKCSDLGYCPIFTMENVGEMYTAYHKLGGNGVCTNIMERLNKLPTEDLKKQGDKH